MRHAILAATPLSVVLGLVVLTMPLEAAERLEWKQVSGRQHRYEVETKTEQILTLAGMNIETKSSTFQLVTSSTGEKSSEGLVPVVEKINVLQVDLQVAGMMFHFDSGNASEPPKDGAFTELQKLYQRMSRTPITTWIDPYGRVESVEFPDDATAGLDPSFLSFFSGEKRKKAIQQTRDFLPTEPVSKGQTWDRELQVDLGSGQTLSFTNRYEYQGTVEGKDKTLHRITMQPVSVTYSMDPASPSPLKVTQSELKVTDSKAEILFDNENGCVERRATTMRIEGSLTMQVADKEFPGKLDLKLSEKTSRQP